MEDEALLIEKPEAKSEARHVSSYWVLYILILACFTLLLAAVGFGVALRKSQECLRVGLHEATTNNDIHIIVPSPSLEFVPLQNLINLTALNRRGDFVVSKNTAVREFEFNISHALAAPDGFTKLMILVNGQSPGPKIEANSGDTIRVHVNNHMVNTSTSIHFHGIDQKNSILMDGVAGVTQCPIPPGQSFTYELRCIGQRGTFWYHAHISVQYSDGLYGPIIIHDPDELVPAVDDEKIIFVGDFHHTSAETLVQSYLQPGSRWAPDVPGVEPLPDNFLVNGQHTYDCSVASTTWPDPVPLPTNDTSVPTCSGGQLHTTTIIPGQTVRLRLINHSSFMSFWFSIDNHTLSIVEIDGIEIQPLAGLPGVYLNIGQRYSVLVTADQPVPGNYYMRASLPQTCFLPYAYYVSAGLMLDLLHHGLIMANPTSWS